MATPPTTTQSYASVYSLCQTLDLDGYLDPTTGYCARLGSICEKVAGDEDVGEVERELAGMEGDTWRLMQVLLGQRIYSSSSVDEEKSLPAEGGGGGGWKSQQTTCNTLIQSNEVLTELVIVREWLMDTYKEKTSIPVDAGSTMGYWRFTTSEFNQSLRLGRSTHGTSTSGGKKLDPDGPTRMGTATRLNSDDIANDATLCHVLYQLIRAGQLDDAFQVCWNANQPWRAASLRGSIMFGWDEGEGGYEGNLTRSLWKKMCLRVALNPAISDSERLLYASLVPLSSVQSILRKGIHSFQDALWMYSSTLIEERLDALLERADAHSGYSGVWGDEEEEEEEEQQPQGEAEDVNMNTDMDQESDELQWEDDVRSSLEALVGVDVTKGQPPTHPLNQTQLYLILNKLNTLYRSFVALLNGPSIIPTPLLRFFTHLTLFLRHTSLDSELDPQLSNFVLSRWVGSLESSSSTSTTNSTSSTTLIPLYTNALGGDLAIQRYSSWLADWSRGKSGRECRDVFDLATTSTSTTTGNGNGELDGVRVAVRTAEICVERGLKAIPAPTLTTHLPNLLLARESTHPTTDEDELVKSLQWTLIYPSTHYVALEQCTLLTRRFLVVGRLGLARRVMGLMMMGSSSSSVNEATTTTTPKHTQSEYTDYLYFMQIWELFDRFDSLSHSLSHQHHHRNSQGGGGGGGREREREREIEEVLTELNIKIRGLLVRSWLIWAGEDQDLGEGDVNRQEEGTGNGEDEDGEEDKGSIRIRIRIRAIWIPEIVIRFMGGCLGYLESSFPSSPVSSSSVDGILTMIMDMIPILGDNRYKLFEDFLNGGRLKDLLTLVQNSVLKSVQGGTGTGTGTGTGGGDLFRLVKGVSSTY